ncbi:hypothetical protein K9M09_02300 [Patescibacteria group bacterium]|nr:hypothetical protein [Patescibacteria group bacterium]
MKKLRKFLTLSVMVMSIAVMSGFASLSPANASAQAGDLIKMDGLSSVYYLGADGKRYVFPSESVYFSWYSDFSGVVTIPASELQTYPLGSNVTMRPGTNLVKITTDPKVYAVSADGTLRWVQSEADAIALFGADWASKVVDVADSFFTNYTIGTPLVSGTYPAGTLLKNANNASVYYFDGTNYRMIGSDAAFTANRFSYSNIVTTTMTLTASGATITGMEDFSKPSGSVGGTVITGSGLTVALASNTPAGMGIPAAAPVDFLKINLTAASDGDINVSSIKLTAFGLGVATYIDDATFYDNGLKVGTSKNFNADREAIFNFSTPIKVSAGTTKTLTVGATIEASQTGNFVIGIESASDIISSGASVTGSFPIQSNQMSIVSGTTLGTVTLSNAVGTDSSNQFGEDNILLASFDLAAAHEDVLAQQLRFRNGGTDTAGIVSNLKLFIDGTEVADGTYADKYATFNLNNYKITNGDSVNVEVRGDLGVTNNNDTFTLYIKDRGDFVFLGQSYGFGVQLTSTSFATLDTTTEGITVTLGTGQFTIDMDNSATPAKDVKIGDNNVVLATISLKSNGENATIEQIVDNGSNTFEIQGTGLAAGEIENVEMVDVATGGVYDITATHVSDTAWTLSMTDEIALVKDVAKVFQVRADMSDTTSAEIDDGDTLKVTLGGAAMTITGDVSGSSITDVTPSSVTSAVTTIKAAALTWSPTALQTQTVVGGASDIVVYQASLKAGTADSVKLQTVTISTLGTDAAFTDSDITKLDLYLNGNLLKSVSNGIVETTGGADGYITFNSLNTAYNVIPAGQTVSLMVKATFASTITAAGSFDLEMESADDVVSRAVSSNDAVTENADGTTISGVSGTVTTATVGTIKVELLTNNGIADEDAQLLAGASLPADRYLAELKFTTTNEPIKVTKLSLDEGGTSGSDDIATVSLVTASGTVVASAIPATSGNVVFDPFDYVFPADQATSLFVQVNSKGMNVLGDASATADYGQTVVYNIPAAASSITATGENSGTAITLAVSADGTIGAGEWSQAATTSKTATITGSLLTTIANAMDDGLLTGGTAKTLGKYTFVFDNGSNRNTSNEELMAYLDAISFTVSKSASTTITNAYAQIEGTATKVAGDITTLGDGNTSGSIAWLTGELQGLSGSGKLDGTVTLVITGDVTTSSTVGEYVQTSLADVAGAGDVDYIGDGLTTGTPLTATYMNVSEVIGATLSE